MPGIWYTTTELPLSPHSHLFDVFVFLEKERLAEPESYEMVFDADAFYKAMDEKFRRLTADERASLLGQMRLLIRRELDEYIDEPSREDIGDLGYETGENDWALLSADEESYSLTDSDK